MTLNVNGKKIDTNVEPRVTLLDALRNYLDVTGCKRVCDRGTCGACTVMLDGKPVYSCTMLALEAQGKKIRTAESLVDGGKLDAVPAAFVARRRPAVRLLHAGLRRRHAGRPRQQPQGHARRGREGPVRQHLPLRHLRADARRHRRPVQQPSGRRAESWQPIGPKKRRLIGTKVPRLDGPEKATGKAKYSFDINRPGMLHAVILRCPHAHAKIKSIDTAAAEKMPGFKALHLIVKAGRRALLRRRRDPRHRRRHRGARHDALRAVKVEYEVLPHQVKEEDALQKDLETRPESAQEGDARTSSTPASDSRRQTSRTRFKEADVVDRGHLRHADHLPPVPGIARPGRRVGQGRDGPDRLGLDAGVPVNVAGELAAALQAARRAKVKCITHYMGGGFGSKFAPDIQGIAAAELARKAKAPVKLMLDRAEEVTIGGNRPVAFGKVKIGARKMIVTGVRNGVVQIKLMNQGDGAGFDRCYQEAAPRALQVLASGRLAEHAADASVTIETAGSLMFVPALVNGVQVRLLLDTGAGKTIVRPLLAQLAGIEPGREAPLALIIVAGGGQLSVPLARARSLAINEAAVLAIEIGIYEAVPDLPDVDGILGSDYLSHFTVTIDRQKGTLLLVPARRQARSD